MSVSRFRQCSIVVAALLEYVAEGSGCVNAGGAGSRGESGTQGGEVVAQAESSSASSGSVFLQLDFTSACSDECICLRQSPKVLFVHQQ